jgi:hypothetical protein
LQQPSRQQNCDGPQQVEFCVQQKVPGEQPGPFAQRHGDCVCVGSQPVASAGSHAGAVPQRQPLPDSQ